MLQVPPKGERVDCDLQALHLRSSFGRYVLKRLQAVLYTWDPKCIETILFCSFLPVLGLNNSAAHRVNRPALKSRTVSNSHPLHCSLCPAERNFWDILRLARLHCPNHDHPINLSAWKHNCEAIDCSLLLNNLRWAHRRLWEPSSSKAQIKEGKRLVKVPLCLLFTTSICRPFFEFCDGTIFARGWLNSVAWLWDQMSLVN